MPRSPQDRIIIRHVFVDPSDVALGCLVPIVVIADGVQKPGVLEVHALAEDKSHRLEDMEERVPTSIETSCLDALALILQGSGLLDIGEGRDGVRQV